MDVADGDTARSTYGERQHSSRGLFAVPDYLILGGAGISFLLSVTLWFSGQQDAGLFVGIWVPSIVSFGVYVKLCMPGGRS